MDPSPRSTGSYYIGTLAFIKAYAEANFESPTCTAKMEHTRDPEQSEAADDDAGCVSVGVPSTRSPLRTTANSTTYRYWRMRTAGPPAYPAPGFFMARRPPFHAWLNYRAPTSYERTKLPERPKENMKLIDSEKAPKALHVEAPPHYSAEEEDPKNEGQAAHAKSRSPET
ncbi:predicted protein [Verticillium alfalfae VaMs.102]|uniref:Predicted protein n=1 Tax=Verticillium alfalfae (strain VaMs.102 / ATCC MYA-4576 / FGSC 10136) TaxID=526221 RepID=C9SWQ4_VERA1|nr:predicted protein [Verticillium alfalfae VaMs.102]EEY23445.1 predicted protein [Verticillium alfalfae VaMs.102]